MDSQVMDEVDHLVAEGVCQYTACQCVAERFELDADDVSEQHMQHVTGVRPAPAPR